MHPARAYRRVKPFDDLLKTNIDFLNGHISSTFYYTAAIDRETLPMRNGLIALHRRQRLFTTQSQPGTCVPRVYSQRPDLDQIPHSSWTGRRRRLTGDCTPTLIVGTTPPRLT